MVRKKQGKKNKTKRVKISCWAHFKSVLYNAGVFGYSLLIRPPTIPYNGIDTITLYGLVPFIAWGVFPATILWGGLRILLFIYPAVKFLAGVVWETISQTVVSLVATFFRMDKSPQVLDRRIQLWLYIQSAFSSTKRKTPWGDIKTLFRRSSGQALLMWLFPLLILAFSVLGILIFVATFLTIQSPFLIPDMIVMGLKTFFVATVWSLEWLGLDKPFRYVPTLKREFSFVATSTKTYGVQAQVNRIVLSPVKTVVAMKFAEALNVIRSIRVRIPTMPRFRAYFRFGIPKVVIARYIFVIINISSWIGILGPVYTPGYPEDLVVFFAVINMVSSILISLTLMTSPKNGAGLVSSGLRN